MGNYVSNLCNHLNDYGYNVSIFTVKRLTEQPHLKSHIIGSGYQNIEYINCFYLPGWPYPTLRSVSIPLDAGAKLKSHIKNGNFDLVHVHGLQYPLTWLAVHFSRQYSVRSVLSLHGTYPILNPGKETKIEKWLYRHLFSRVLSRADAVIGPAENITSFAKKYQRGKLTSFHTVRWGLDTDRFRHNLEKKMDYRKKYDIAEKAKVLMFSGRFEKIKGILEFCSATKRIVEESNNSVESIIIGSGTLKDEVLSIVNNTAGIHLFDWQPEDKIHQFYIASDLIVVPSRSEAMPLTILEAMNVGLHIVYTPVGGIPDILKEYPLKTQLRAVSENEIYNVLSNLIASDLDNTQRLSSLKYAQGFDWKQAIKDITTVYERLTSSSPKSIL